MIIKIIFIHEREDGLEIKHQITSDNSVATFINGFWATSNYALSYGPDTAKNFIMPHHIKKIERISP